MTLLPLLPLVSPGAGAGVCLIRTRLEWLSLER